MKMYAMTSAAVLIMGAAAATALTNGIADNAQKGVETAQMLTTTTTEATTEATTYTYIDTNGLPNKKYGWYYNPNKTHAVPTVQAGINYKKYNAYYVGNTASKVIYLTFDEGYENGYSGKILDILKQKQVKAAFFCTKPYIDANPELIKRMQAEGHIVGNHTEHHKSSPDLTDAQFAAELNNTAAAYKSITGYDMPKYFRPPMGEYSERTLALANNMGYKTVFWSFAHRDWEVNNQPTATYAHNIVMERYHNGAILLLHAVSSANTQALPSIIDDLKAQGYSFETLDKLQ